MLVSTVLAHLAAGRTETDVRQHFPALGPDTIRAALAYAAEVVGTERVPATTG